MAVVKNLMVRAGADFSELEKELQKAQKSLQNAGAKLSSIGKSLTIGLTLPIVAAGTASFKLASDFEESLNKVNVAFGDNADGVVAWSKTTLKEFGMAQGSALDMAALFGDMSTSMGMSTPAAAKMSQSLVGLAGDLASFKNIGIDEAQTALKSIFTGETESLKNLGIVMTQTNLNAFAMSKGMNKTVQEMTQAEQVQLRYAYVMKMTKNAQGDFANTSDGAANQMRIFTESLKELGASFGQILLPAITPIIEKINSAIQKFGELDEGTKKNIVTILAIVAAVGPLLSIIGGLATGLGSIVTIGKSIKTIILGVKAAFAVLSGPVGIVIAVIAALIAIGIVLYKNWDVISAWLTQAWENIKKAAVAVWTAIKDFFKKIWDGIKAYFEFWINLFTAVFKAAWEGIKTHFTNVWEGIKKVFKSVVDNVKKIFDIFSKAFKGDWEGVWNGIKDFFKGIWDGIVGIAEDAVNGVIKLINKVTGLINKIPGINIGTIGEVDFNGSNIQKHADGGVFTRPTMWGNHLIGESGPEALVPLDRLAGAGSANIFIELDGYTIARAMGQPLTDMIKVKTGVRI